MFLKRKGFATNYLELNVKTILLRKMREKSSMRLGQEHKHDAYKLKAL